MVRLWSWGWPFGRHSRWFSSEAANGSPSPWGEGRDEGGRDSFISPRNLQSADSQDNWDALRSLASEFQSNKPGDQEA